MLSVICPIYNEEEYINQCIESILMQDYPKNDLEILFVDGMSKDKTRDIVKEYSEKYPFIHLLDNPKKIVPCAMNIGIKASRGDIIIRLDAELKKWMKACGDEGQATEMRAFDHMPSNQK